MRHPIPYTVLYHYGSDDNLLFSFRCKATDADDADEQFKKLFPSAKIVWTIDTGDLVEAANDYIHRNQHLDDKEITII